MRTSRFHTIKLWANNILRSLGHERAESEDQQSVVFARSRSGLGSEGQSESGVC